MTYKNVNSILEKNVVPEGYEEFADTLRTMEEFACILRKMKEKEPNTKFILPNGKEAVLNDKKEQQKPSK